MSDKLSYTGAVEQCSATERTQLVIHTRHGWISKALCWGRSQSQKLTHWMILWKRTLCGAVDTDEGWGMVWLQRDSLRAFLGQGNCSVSWWWRWWHGHMDIYIVKAQKTTHLNTKLILLNLNLKITLKTPWGTCFSLGSPKNTEIRHWGLGIGLQSESRNRKWRNEKSETEKGEKFFVVV